MKSSREIFAGTDRELLMTNYFGSISVVIGRQSNCCELVKGIKGICEYDSE